MKKTIFMLFISLTSFPAFSQEKKMDTTSTGEAIYTCPVIEKSFVNKIGEEMECKELYLRCSVQDYFIKLCESDVSAAELQTYLEKSAKFVVEICEGYWDICPDDPLYMQSRVGKYIIIRKIID